MEPKTIVFCFLFHALFVFPAFSQNRSALIGDFEESFGRQLANPTQFSKKVHNECHNYPEGSLYPYTMVAMAWCHQIFRTPSRAESLMPRIETLLKLGLSSSARVLKPPGGDFSKLTSTGRQGGYLSNLAMALSTYRLAGGSQSYLVNVENCLNRLLINELASRNGGPIESSPGSIWPFDTTAALFSIEMHDRVSGSANADALVSRHRQWILAHGIDSSSGLPGSRLLRDGSFGAARGCDLSWRLALWSELDPELSQKWYRSFHSQFWKHSHLAIGFKEWKRDKTKTVDLFSGPMIKGVGTGATAFGLCAALAHSDQSSAESMVSQAVALDKARKSNDFISRVKMKTIYKSLNGAGIKTSPRDYQTGYLYGDASAFYAMSWTAYPSRPVR